MLHDLRAADGRRKGFDELLSSASDATLGTIRVRLASLADIIEAKRFANRDKDRDALPELEQLLRETENE